MTKDLNLEKKKKTKTEKKTKKIGVNQHKTTWHYQNNTWLDFQAFTWDGFWDHSSLAHFVDFSLFCLVFSSFLSFNTFSLFCCCFETSHSLFPHKRLMYLRKNDESHNCASILITIPRSMPFPVHYTTIHRVSHFALNSKVHALSAISPYEHGAIFVKSFLTSPPKRCKYKNAWAAKREREWTRNARSTLSMLVARADMYTDFCRISFPYSAIICYDRINSQTMPVYNLFEILHKFHKNDLL